MSVNGESLSTMTTQRAPAVLRDRNEAVAVAKSLTSSIASRVAQTEEARTVPVETITELIDSGLFGVVTPKLWGGSELGFRTLIEVQAELASACASTGWVYGVLAGHNWLAALFPPQAQEEVFADRRSLIASLIRVGGEAPVRVDGGFRWSGGQGRFCSGIDHSDWLLAGGAVTGDDGTAEPWFFLIPRQDLEVVDDWHTVGLCGTGSKSLIVCDAFIPEHRAVRFADLAAGRAPGAALHSGVPYTLPFDAVWPLSLPGTALGAARGALAAFTAATAKRLQALPPDQQAAQGAVLSRLAKAAAQIDAAAALLLADAASADEAPPGTAFDAVERARRRRNLAYAVQQCREAVNGLYEAGGGSSIYLNAPLRRWWCDVNAAAAHVVFTWDVASVAYGRAAAGLGAPDIAKPRPSAAPA